MSNAEKTNQDLVGQVQSGDAIAFRGLVKRYQGQIYAHIYGMVRNREEARDLTQEAFARAYRNIGGLRLEASFETWIYRIATNVTIDHIRKHGSVNLSEPCDSIANIDEGDGACWDPEHLRRTPEKDLEREQIYARIMRKMELLTEEERQVILMREIEGSSYGEIAVMMSLTEGAVIALLFDARKKLEKLLAEGEE